MKNNDLKWVSVVAVTVATLALAPVRAGTEAQKALVNKAIEKAPVAELAAKAADLVSNAKASERTDLAVTAVEVIVSKHPTAAATVVAAIAKAAPGAAAKAAAKAAELNPAHAAIIARAAALAAPRYASQVAVAVSNRAPKSATQVAQAVMFAVPSQAVQIADAVAAAQPQTQASLQPLSRRVARANNPAAEPPIPPSFRYAGEPINPLALAFEDRGVAVNVSDLETFGPDPVRPYATP
jgi:hypothetical protein